MGTMDDNYLIGLLHLVIAAYKDMKAAFKTIMLELNDGKLQLLCRRDLSPEERAALVDAGVPPQKIDEVKRQGFDVAGSPVGPDEYIRADLDKRYEILNALAAKLERLAEKPNSSWQGLLALVQQCVATMNLHLARTLRPDVLREFAARVDLRMACLSLRVSGLNGAAAESPDLYDDIELRNKRILLSASLGGWAPRA